MKASIVAMVLLFDSQSLSFPFSIVLHSPNLGRNTFLFVVVKHIEQKFDKEVSFCSA